MDGIKSEDQSRPGLIEPKEIYRIQLLGNFLLEGLILIVSLINED